MSNLTISLDDHIIKAARIRALQQGTSVSAKVREFLASYVEDAQAPNPQLAAGQAFIAAARSSKYAICVPLRYLAVRPPASFPPWTWCSAINCSGGMR